MHYPSTAASPGGTIEASVLAGGSPLKLYRRADGRMFAAGIPGSIYTLRVRNLTAARIEAIASVDGRHVLKDEAADPRSCHGMVLRQGESYEFRGWRVSDQQTREFLFGDPGSSVAAQATGSASNVGVIGFAAWRERDAWVTNYGSGYSSFSTRGAPDVAVASSSPVAFAANVTTRGSLGTGIGASQDDRVGRIGFERTAGEPDILIVGYDTESELIRRGITCPADPDPFPGALTGYEKYAAR